MKDVNNEDEDYSGPFINKEITAFLQLLFFSFPLTNFTNHNEAFFPPPFFPETVHTISTYSLPNDDDLVLEDNDSDQSETVQTRLNTDFNASAVTPTQISVNDSESSLAFCAESKSSEVTSLDSGIPKEALTIRRKPPPCPTHRPPPPPKDVAPVLFPIKLTSLPPMETQDKQDTLPAPVQNQAFTSKNCLSLLPKTTQQNIQEKSEKSEKPQSKIEQVKPLQGQFVLDFKDISAKRVKIIEEDHNEKPKTGRSNVNKK